MIFIFFRLYRNLRDFTWNTAFLWSKEKIQIFFFCKRRDCKVICTVYRNYFCGKNIPFQTVGNILQQIPRKIVIVCIFNVLLIIVLPRLAIDISRSILEPGIEPFLFHPVLGLAFYSPGATIKVSALYFVLKEVKMKYPTYMINFEKMLFRLFVITFVVSIVVFSPSLIFTKATPIVVVVWFIAMGIYKWESKNKKLIL